MRHDKCRSCQRPIIWVKMEKSGKSNPLDAQPGPGGNVAINVDGTARVLAKDEIAVTDPMSRYVSHFVTCRDAKKFRKPKAS